MHYSILAKSKYEYNYFNYKYEWCNTVLNLQILGEQSACILQQLQLSTFAITKRWSQWSTCKQNNALKEHDELLPQVEFCLTGNKRNLQTVNFCYVLAVNWPTDRQKRQA